MTNVQQAIPKGAVEFRRSARDEHTMSKIKRSRNASCCAKPQGTLPIASPLRRGSLYRVIHLNFNGVYVTRAAGYREHVCSCMFCISVARPVAHFAYINL